MERGGSPHPDEVEPPSVEDGIEFYWDLKDLGEHPPIGMRYGIIAPQELSTPDVEEE